MKKKKKNTIALLVRFIPSLDENIEKADIEMEQNLQKGIDIARKHNINLTKFKQEISKHLTTKNNEDQWTWDYQSYLEYLAISAIFQTPTEWGKEFYYKRWQDER